MLVKAEKIFDPKRGLLENGSLVVKDGKIAAIYEDSSHDAIEKAHGAITAQFFGEIITPPFCDYHLHFFASSWARSKEISAGLAEAGITVAYEAGDAHLSGLQAKEELRGKVDIKTCGLALHKEGGYGDFLGRGIKDFRDARPIIDELAEKGVDYIKIINSGIYMPHSHNISGDEFDPGELFMIVDYAHEKGLSVFCHANGETGTKSALEAHVDAIVHGFYITEETLSAMAERGVRFIPTINALASLTKVEDTPEAKESINNLVKEHVKVVRKARELGVTVLPGSDSGPNFIPYGNGYLDELSLFKEAGFSDEEILKVATSKPLEAGSPANFVVLTGLAPQHVFLDGVRVG